MNGEQVQSFVDLSSMFRHNRAMFGWVRSVVESVETTALYSVLNTVKSDTSYGGSFGRVNFAQHVLSLMSKGWDQESAELFVDIGDVDDKKRFVASELVKLYMSLDKSFTMPTETFTHLFIVNNTLNVDLFTDDTTVHKVLTVLPIVFDSTLCMRTAQKSTAEDFMSILKTIDVTKSHNDVENSVFITAQYPDMVKYIESLPLRWEVLTMSKTRENQILAFFMGAVSSKHSDFFSSHLDRITEYLKNVSDDVTDDSPLVQSIHSAHYHNIKKSFVFTLPPYMMFYLMERCGEDVDMMLEVMGWVVKLSITTEKDFSVLHSVIDNIDTISGLPVEWVHNILSPDESTTKNN